MTPRALDPDSVHARLALMRRALHVLDAVGEVTRTRLEQDDILRGAVERYLSQLVDLATAINAHIAGAVLSEVPADYNSSFSLAARAGAIDQDLAESLAPSAGMRNVLIHDYAAVDLDLVAAALPEARRGFAAYVRQVAAFLLDQDS